MSEPILAPMTLQEARATAWQFREYKGQPIGNLLDNGSISLRDLAWAFQNAYNQKIKDAAKTILLHYLGQVTEPTEDNIGGLNVVSSPWRSFSERRQMQFAMLMGAVNGFFIGSGLIISILFMFSRNNGQELTEEQIALQSNPIFIVAVIIFFLIFVAIFHLTVFKIPDWITDRLERQMRLHRKGQRGEERVLNAMYQALDGHWWLFRNVELPGRKLGDIDFVLVGPQGVWVMETKAYSGSYRNIGEQWEARSKRGWRLARRNPSAQAKRNALALSSVFKSQKIDQWVQPLVIWANPEATLTSEYPAVPIWELDHISNQLTQVQAGKKISDDNY